MAHQPGPDDRAVRLVEVATGRLHRTIVGRIGIGQGFWIVLVAMFATLFITGMQQSSTSLHPSRCQPAYPQHCFLHLAVEGDNLYLVHTG